MAAGRFCQKWGMTVVTLALVCGVGGGCTWSRKDPSQVDLGVEPSDAMASHSAAVRDTIGYHTYYEGLRPMRVRGYGLVSGLGTNGSRDCPAQIYSELVQRIHKRQQRANRIGVKIDTPEEMIRSLGSAVVTVYGEIPRATVAGTPFDVVVRAVPGTQTKSLRGGYLFLADLEMYHREAGRRAVTGRVLARATGPLFMNPFSDEQAATQSSPLEGIVLNGARVVEDRRLRLVLVQPSYQWARRIQDRINSRFGGDRKIADAISPSFIRLHIPEEFRDSPGHFLALVRQLYITHDPRFEAVRMRELAREILQPGAPHAEIALCFEGIGHGALPVLQDLYAHAKSYVSFHTAVVGLRLGDHLGCDAVVVHAENPAGEYRFMAIRALAEGKGMAGAAIALRHLLDDEDPRVQTAAYEALVERDDATIDSIPIGLGSFVLDVVPTRGDPFIYAKRSGSQRIALFGEDLRCRAPVFYVAPDNTITINAQEGDEALTLIRQDPTGKASSPPIPAPFELIPLIRLLGNDVRMDRDGNVTGLGLDYAAVVRALCSMAKDGSITARFVLEQPNVTDMLGPVRPAGRPESELEIKDEG